MKTLLGSKALQGLCSEGGKEAALCRLLSPLKDCARAWEKDNCKTEV